MFADPDTPGAMLKELFGGEGVCRIIENAHSNFELQIMWFCSLMKCPFLGLPRI